MPQLFVYELVDPFSLSSLWIALGYLTIVFIAVIELLATIWAIAELRTRLHLLKQQRRQQAHDFTQHGDFTRINQRRTVSPRIRRTQRLDY